jgi:hypothetical protein
MVPDTNTTEETQFVLRRLEEALHLFGREIEARWFWVLVLILVLSAGFFYVGWMYKRDSRSVGWMWASFLGLLRCMVYAILAAVFLLPAFQTWNRTELHSKVVMLDDASGSMGNRDDLPTEAMPAEKLKSRQDKIIDFLTDDRAGFLKKLQDKNPVYAYRFGTKIDPDFKLFEGGKVVWSTSDWAEWLKPNPLEPEPQGLNDEAKKKYYDRISLFKDLVNGTNLGTALTEVANRESNNMVNAVVLISDGRNSAPQFSQDQIDEVKSRFKKAKIPIFTVAVGEYREPISIRITDLQAPEQARPDDKFPVRVEIEGEGLPNRELVVYLDVTGPKGDLRTKDKPVKLNAGSGGVPRAQVEFEIDGAEFGVPPAPGKKPELEEGKWIFQARVPKDKREVYIPKEHKSEKQTVHIIKKPLRVLLFAGAPTRDYQFIRNMLVREMDQHKVELSICLQLQREGVVQDVPPDRFLSRFPDKLGDDADARPEDRNYNLAQYDLILAFDPDWSLLQDEQLKALEKWVNQQAGGLVLIAGPVNTYQIARAGNREKLKPMLDMCPVLLQDSRLQALGFDRPTTEPWRLNFPGATAEMEFLKLDEESTDQLAGWDEFFTGKPKGEIDKDTPTVRGIYNYYPLDGVKPSATVVATFSDPRARLREGNKEQPYLVTMPYGSGKVVYLGSGEMWRLRQYKEVFFERFWTKLARYAGSGNLSRVNRYGQIYMSSTFPAGQFALVRAKLFGRDLQPLPPNSRPPIVLKPPPGVTMPTKIVMEPEPTQGGEWQGWFQARFRVMVLGEYNLDLTVPDSGEIQSKKFMVKETNPELDNTRPDFGQLYQLASEVTDYLPRMEKDVQDEIKQAVEGTAARLLQRVEAPEGPARRETNVSKTAPAAAKDKPAETKDVPRFFFDLTTAHLIPKCMVTESKIQRSRGKVEDMWDQGFTLVSKGDEKHDVRMATVLIIVASLLSVEWLTRKLLKLA